MTVGFTFVDHHAGTPRGGSGKATRLAEWTGIAALPDRLRTDLAREMGRPLSLRESARGDSGQVVGARLNMIEVRSLRHLCVTLSLPLLAARQLVIETLGAGDQAMVLSFAGELANLAAGAVKRWAPPDVDLTLGLPRPFIGEEPARFSDLIVDMVHEDVAIRCALHLRPTTSSNLSVRGLEEGMVLASDVRDEQGTRLFHAGQRLTSSSIEVLQTGVGHGLRFDVVDGS